MEKIKELGWKPVAAAGAVLGLLAGILGVAGVGVGALIVGILAAVVTFGGVFIICGDGTSGSGGKGDKYKKLFMNLPIGFAQAKIIDDPVNGVSYQIVDANEIFGEYFKLDVSDYTGKNLKESKIEVLQDINAWFTAYNNSGTKEGDLMDVEITMESLQKVFNTVMYKSEADYINMVVIDITDQKDTENKLSKAIVDANAAYKTQAEFLANMSHEIRTPINGILGMLQLTLMADDLQADYRDNLVTAKNCADTLLRLINDILDISKLEAGKYKIKEETFEQYLDTKGIPDPDLMIRTSGDLRLSNYLLWQLAYSEFYFTDVPWPDFGKEELEKAVEAYNKRDRRFGGLAEEAK